MSSNAIMEKNSFTKYFDVNLIEQKKLFTETLFALISTLSAMHSNIIFLCIGSDRATGDSFGPLIGSKIASSKLHSKEIVIFGSLNETLHALNLEFTINKINALYDNPFIVAIDASLGNENKIGLIKLGTGSISPGEGVQKKLPSIGNLFITGIVNQDCGKINREIIQSTKLSLVLKMADFVSDCVNDAISLL